MKSQQKNVYIEIEIEISCMREKRGEDHALAL